jgi:hypothetical protein
MLRLTISWYPLLPRLMRALNIGRPRKRREFSIPMFSGDGMSVVAASSSGDVEEVTAGGAR